MASEGDGSLVYLQSGLEVVRLSDPTWGDLEARIEIDDMKKEYC